MDITGKVRVDMTGKVKAYHSNMLKKYHRGEEGLEEENSSDVCQFLVFKL